MRRVVANSLLAASLAATGAACADTPKAAESAEVIEGLEAGGFTEPPFDINRFDSFHRISSEKYGGQLAVAGCRWVSVTFVENEDGSWAPEQLEGGVHTPQSFISEHGC